MRLGKNRKTLVTREDVLARSSSEYEALIAIAKEARRLNAVPGLHLKGEEKAIPKAVENFVTGRVEYEVDGVPASELAAEAACDIRAAKRKKGTRKAGRAKASTDEGADEGAEEKVAAGKPRKRVRKAK